MDVDATRSWCCFESCLLLSRYQSTQQNSLFQEMLEILHEELKEMRGRRAAAYQLALVNVSLSF